MPLETSAKRIEMLVFLHEGEDESYDQLSEIDRLDLKRKPVDVKTFTIERDAETARELRVEEAPAILLVKNGEILKRLNGLTEASTLESALVRVQEYRDPFLS